MNELQKAIEELSGVSRKLPKKAIRTVIKNREEALPYLRRALQKAIEERDELDENYLLPFYALFLLAELHDKEAFPIIMEFAALPGEVLDYMIGDVITENFQDIVYYTYNGDLRLLKDRILDEEVYEFVRGALLKAMGQLYLDGILEEKEWREFIRQGVYCGQEYSNFYNVLGTMICGCHFFDMLPEIRYMLNEELMDEMYLGKYDSCVDAMFEYREQEKDFCNKDFHTAEILKHWAMFESTENSKEEEKRFRELSRESIKAMNLPKAVKVGRNDPCPCGSGKKYKFCCMNKEKSPVDKIESVQERTKCLEFYPYVGEKREEGRIYLEDYFDRESIEIDKLLYLGLAHRFGLIWLRDEDVEEERCRQYLTLAFEKFEEKVQKEGIENFREYDKKYGIHYFCGEWTEKLAYLLKKNKEKELYKRVERCRKQMM